MSSESAPLVDLPCPIGRAAELIGDRWTLLILRQATLGVTRFDEFRGALGIADNILSNRLARLVENGLLARVAYRDERRTRHEYRLTQAGADTFPVLGALAAWGSEHTRPARDTEPMRVIHAACGSDLPAARFCERCGRAVGRDEVLWLRPWHSPEPQPLAEPVA
jgi:DNA-binding HxlR family transcriptional regulator